LKERAMWDVVFLVATVVLFWISILYTRRCDRI
jgi:hypothetical protein